jgi:hypothetical protein
MRNSVDSGGSETAGLYLTHRYKEIGFPHVHICMQKGKRFGAIL